MNNHTEKFHYANTFVYLQLYITLILKFLFPNIFEHATF